MWMLCVQLPRSGAHKPKMPRTDSVRNPFSFEFAPSGRFSDSATRVVLFFQQLPSLHPGIRRAAKWWQEAGETAPEGCPHPRRGPCCPEAQRPQPPTLPQNEDAHNTQTPADQPTGAPSPSPDSECWRARRRAQGRRALIFGEPGKEKRANQAEREATSLRRTIDASSEIARRRNALLRNGGSWLQRGGGDDGADAPKGGVPLPGLSEVGPPPPPSQDASPLPAHIEERLRQLQLPDAWAGEVRDLILQSRDEAQRDVVDAEFDVDSTPPPSPEGEVWS